MKSSQKVIIDQYRLFEAQLEVLIKELSKSKRLDPESVKELIYTARQFINRKNKVKKIIGAEQ